jgi:hypothetical protein
MSNITIGGASLPAIMKDPFRKTKVTKITTWASVNVFNDEWTFTGDIYFKNGNTEGKQAFNGDSFDDVVLKMKACLDSLE